LYSNFRPQFFKVALREKEIVERTTTCQDETNILRILSHLL
jgi:hypothetical protein